jgi:O-antigen ligase
MVLLLPVVAAMVSLLIAPGWSFAFDVVPKVAIVLAGAALATLWTRERPQTAPASLKWFGVILAAQAASLVLATAFSTDPARSVLGSSWRRSGLPAELAVLALAGAAAIAFAIHADSRRMFLRITVLASVPVATYGCLQYFGVDPVLNAAAYHFGEGVFRIVRPPSTLGHAAYFATYLLYAAFAGLALAAMESERIWKRAAWSASALAVIGIALSGTRAALLGLLAGAVFIAVRERARWSWKPMAAGLASLIVVVILVAGFYISPAGEQLRARVHWSAEDSLGGSRLLLWRDTLHMSAGRWLTGYGPETFARTFPEYQSPELGRAYPDFYHESPHNIFLDALGSQGAPGLLALLAMIGLAAVWARGALGAAFIAMLVSQQFTAFTVPTELYFYLCIVLLVSGTPVTGEPRSLPALPRWVMAAGFAGFAIYVSYGDHLLASARSNLEHRQVDAAQRDLQSARNWHMASDIYFSRAFQSLPARDPGERLRAFQCALDAAEHGAGSADDRQNALVNLAAFYAAQENAPAVEQALRQAIATAPNWYKPHFLLAQVLAREGHRDDASNEARLAVGLNGGKSAEVAQILRPLELR